jgi:cobalt-zinc-cadmium efflux system outer membrane protein
LRVEENFMFRTLGSLVLAGSLAGCSIFTGSPYEARDHAPSQSTHRHAGSVRSDDGAAGAAPLSDAGEVGGELTLRRAFELALANNPSLAAAELEIEAREAEALQAGLFPNPELEAEVEDIYGGTTGPPADEQDLSELAAAEATVVISQTIELGGKRRKRRQVAEQEADLASWEFEARRLELLGEIHAVFVELLAAQDRLRLAGGLYVVATRADETAQAKVEAGKVPPLERQRTATALAQVAGERDRAMAEVEGLRYQLAAFWGEDTPRFESASGSLATLLSVPSYEQLVSTLESHPDLARFGNEIRKREAELDLARAQAIPDPTLSVGARYFHETENHAFLFGIGIPIPVFDRNQGNIRAARTRLEQTERERSAASLMLRQKLSAAHRKLVGAERMARRLQDEALPYARQGYETLLEGYQLGEFDLLAVLDAQQAYFDVRNQHLDALTDFHIALAEIETLMGQPLTSAESANSTEMTSEGETRP